MGKINRRLRVWKEDIIINGQQDRSLRKFLSKHLVKKEHFDNAIDHGLIDKKYHLTSKGNEYLGNIITNLEELTQKHYLPVIIMTRNATSNLQLLDYLCDCAFYLNMAHNNKTSRAPVWEIGKKINKIGKTKSIDYHELYAGLASYVLDKGIKDESIIRRYNRIKVNEYHEKSKDLVNFLKPR